MKFSKSTELALHGLMLLGTHQGEMMLVSEMAGAQKVSESYLAKVFQKLAKKGLVRSTRGKRGGFMLAREPSSITIADVAKAIEAEEPLYDCLEQDRGCTCHKQCLVHKTFRDAEAVMYGALQNTSLGDLLSGVEAAAREGHKPAWIA